MYYQRTDLVTNCAESEVTITIDESIINSAVSTLVLIRDLKTDRTTRLAKLHITIVEMIV
jgi:hypothetical protein